ncbi:MAG: prepilin peptidase [Syntrophothermus sp.]|uniref:prepilin peptidase n=1 Tax=Syntrophothermus sp. TaxID=2736299 RepID=UPI002579DDE5|nr:A24 family peptidase [Syntrophothermus sp.]NSW82726.1 prepilin peptidase [Syntrophothermus sp.]
METTVYLACLVPLTIAGLIDLFKGVLPNIIVLPVMAGGLIYNAWHGSFINSLEGFLVCIVFGMIAAWFGWMGAGDGKLMGAVGAWLGLKPLELLAIFLIACILGIIAALVKMIWTGQLWQWLKKFCSNLKVLVLTRDLSLLKTGLQTDNPWQQVNAIPFGMFIVIGVWAVTHL